MKDALGYTIVAGDLVAHTFEKYYGDCCPLVGIIEGTKTPGNKIRYISDQGRKENAKQHTLIKINKEQALNILNRFEGELGPKRLKFIEMIEEMY